MDNRQRIYQNTLFLYRHSSRLLIVSVFGDMLLMLFSEIDLFRLGGKSQTALQQHNYLMLSKRLMLLQLQHRFHKIQCLGYMFERMATTNNICVQVGIFFRIEVLDEFHVETGVGRISLRNIGRVNTDSTIIPKATDARQKTPLTAPDFQNSLVANPILLDKLR